MELALARQRAVSILLDNLKSKLNGYEFNDACLDVDVLLEFILGKSRSWILANENYQFDAEFFFDLIDKRISGLPIAYIINKKEFFGLEFFVDKSVLIPKPDTETLVELAIDYIKTTFHDDVGEEFRILDVCSGSGCVGIAIGHVLHEIGFNNGNFRVDFLDVSMDALNITKRNSEKLIPQVQKSFFNEDLRDSLPKGYEVIVSNPPYVPTNDVFNLLLDGRSEPVLALDGGIDGLDLFPCLASGICNSLRPLGRCFLEAGENIVLASEIFRSYGFKNIQIHKDMSNMDRVISACI